MTPLSSQRLYEVSEATWPPARRLDEGPFALRYGAGGGKRVSAATLNAPEDLSDAALRTAEDSMRKMGQVPLFMIRDGDAAFDAFLDRAGYQIFDPVIMFSAECASLESAEIPPLTTFPIWEPLAVMADIWAAGGIGPERIQVMQRAKGPKTAILGRIEDTPAATAFVAVHDGVAMLHALEVAEAKRRKGLARWIMHAAADWAAAHGAMRIAVLCTRANTGANALYDAMGFAQAGAYHYRVKPD